MMSKLKGFTNTIINSPLLEAFNATTSSLRTTRLHILNNSKQRLAFSEGQKLARSEEIWKHFALILTWAYTSNCFRMRFAVDSRKQKWHNTVTVTLDTNMSDCLCVSLIHNYSSTTHTILTLVVGFGEEPAKTIIFPTHVIQFSPTVQQL